MRLEREYAFATISAFLVLFAAMLDASVSLVLAVVLFTVYIILRAARLRGEAP